MTGHLFFFFVSRVESESSKKSALDKAMAATLAAIEIPPKGKLIYH